MSDTICVTCRNPTPGFQTVNFGSIELGYRELCFYCYNEEVAEARNLPFDNRRFEPIRLIDARGEAHEFHFFSHLFLPGVSLNAVELRNGEVNGYRFQVIGDPTGDSLALLGQLIEKMKRALAFTHLEKDTHCGLGIADMTVRARIESDEQEERTPQLIIDGQAVTWEQFGRMLMTFEGFQFRLQIADLSEEI